MANFTYVVKDELGRRKEGTISASNLDAALAHLRQDGLTIISVKDTKEGDLVRRPGMSERISVFIHELRTRIPLRKIVFFTRQLATMFAAGLTLERAVENLHGEERHRRFKRVVATIASDIKKGASLSEALAKHPGAFNPLYTALVRSGEASGSLHVILADLADYLEGLEDTRRKVISAFMYPLVVFSFLIVAVFILVTVVVPRLAGVYAKFQADLPAPTELLIAVSNAISHNILMTILLIILAIVGFTVFTLTDRGRYAVDYAKLRVPFFGTLLLNSIMAKFSRTFGILMGSGVPVLDALGYTYKVVGNQVVKNAINEAATHIKDGYTIADALKRSAVFPSTLLQLVSTGEETGEIDTLLNKASEFYQKQVEAVVARLTSIIEPVMIILIAGVVGGIILVIYLPVFKLGQVMRRGMR
jgi:type IV pilus assembly protein PilC